MWNISEKCGSRKMTELELLPSGTTQPPLHPSNLEEDWAHKENNFKKSEYIQIIMTKVEIYVDCKNTGVSRCDYPDQDVWEL